MVCKICTDLRLQCGVKYPCQGTQAQWTDECNAQQIWLCMTKRSLQHIGCILLSLAKEYHAGRCMKQKLFILRFSFISPRRCKALPARWWSCINFNLLLAQTPHIRTRHKHSGSKSSRFCTFQYKHARQLFASSDIHIFMHQQNSMQRAVWAYSCVFLAVAVVSKAAVNDAGPSHLLMVRVKRTRCWQQLMKSTAIVQEPSPMTKHGFLGKALASVFALFSCIVWCAGAANRKVMNFLGSRVLPVDGFNNLEDILETEDLSCTCQVTKFVTVYFWRCTRSCCIVIFQKCLIH